MGKRKRLYSNLGHLGALVLLAVPPTTPIGFIWTVARAAEARAGRATGPGHDPSPGGGYGRFDVGSIGATGRPLARALFGVAFGYTAVVVAVAYELVTSGAITIARSS